ncbi:MAG: hypothetical protein KGN36_12725 [Acidobacteriota bacterium]|nr:hypothetical protein [Acidobacteriota bacterium]
MSCCGSQRAALRQGAAAAGGSPADYRTGPVEFEYHGGGALRIVGPMTGAVYQFPGSGSRAVVRAADVPSLAMVPLLRPIR